MPKTTICLFSYKYEQMARGLLGWFKLNTWFRIISLDEQEGFQLEPKLSSS